MFLFFGALIYVSNLLSVAKKEQGMSIIQKQGHYLGASACFIFCPPNIDALKSISKFL